MGSGETTTGMLGVHREVFSGLPDPTDARLMDSPFAFQENADELVEKINQYFTESLGHPLQAITLPASADCAGRMITLKKTTADAVAATITPASGTIDGAANNAAIDAAQDTLTIYCDGTNWHIIARQIA